MSKSTISTFELFALFPDVETARKYLEGRLWPQGPRCPVCILGERITARSPKMKHAYSATIRHHTIKRARSIEVAGTLSQAKVAAENEFGQEQLEYVIAIDEDLGGQNWALVSSKRVGGRDWQDER